MFSDEFEIVAVVDGGACPAEEFLQTGDANTVANRIGLATMLRHVAESGFQKLPPGWCHEASKQEQIYEFIKGRLRLFYFKGDGKQIAVCCGGVVKKGAKADKAAVAVAASYRSNYFQAVQDKTLEVIDDEDE